MSGRVWFLGDERYRQEVEFGMIVEIVADPTLVLEAVADAAEADGDAFSNTGRKRPTSWMQRLARNGQASVGASTDAGVPTYGGRACCAEHLLHLEGRTDLRMPFETDCPDCDRRFRVRMGLRPRS